MQSSFSIHVEHWKRGGPARAGPPLLRRSKSTVGFRSEAGRVLSELVLAAGDRDRGAADEEEQRPRGQSAEIGTGARQLAAIAVARIAVVSAVAAVSTAVGAFGDLEGILHGVITAGGGRCVGADIGRSVRRGAEDVDRGSALIIGLDCVLVGGDVDALRVDLEVDVLAGFAVLDRERDALIFVGEVRGLDRLRRDLESRLGGSIGLAVVTIVFADDVDVALEGLGLGAFTVDGDGERNLADLEAVGVAVPPEVEDVVTVSFGRLGLSGQGVLDAVALLDS